MYENSQNFFNYFLFNSNLNQYTFNNIQLNDFDEQAKTQSFLKTKQNYFQSLELSENNLYKKNFSKIGNLRKFSHDSTTESESDDSKTNENSFNNKNNCEKSKFKAHALDFKTKYKTELCKYYESNNGYCQYGDNCAYAHGIDDLRKKTTNSCYYRTKKCTSFFNNGYCPYGNRCQFAHIDFEERKKEQISYSNMLNLINKNIEDKKEINFQIKSKRLPIFEKYAKNEELKLYRLENDLENIKKEGVFKRIN